MSCLKRYFTSKKKPNKNKQDEGEKKRRDAASFAGESSSLCYLEPAASFEVQP